MAATTNVATKNGACKHARPFFRQLLAFTCLPTCPASKALAQRLKPDSQVKDRVRLYQRAHVNFSEKLRLTAASPPYFTELKNRLLLPPAATWFSLPSAEPRIVVSSMLYTNRNAL